jgi:uncharacterized protein YqgV (UPF0045/DUF77 family)
MNIQAEVSLYPLRTARIGPVLERFLSQLGNYPLEVTAGPMSSRLVGNHAEVFAALSEAFMAVAEEQQVVLLTKVSNACPADYHPNTGEKDADASS